MRKKPQGNCNGQGLDGGFSADHRAGGLYLHKGADTVSSLARSNNSTADKKLGGRPCTKHLANQNSDFLLGQRFHSEAFDSIRISRFF